MFKRFLLFLVTKFVNLLEFYCEKTDKMILIKGRPGTNESEDVYLVRYYLLPQGFKWNVYIHRFLRSDHDVPHDHPFDFIGFVLGGGYNEEWYQKDREMPLMTDKTHCNTYIRKKSLNPPGSFIIRQASHIHKVLIDRKYDYSEKHKAPLTVIFRSPRYQDWGFWNTEATIGNDKVRAYWVQWQEYLGIDEDYEKERA